MKYKLGVLALTLTVVLGASGVVVALNPDETPETELPENHTIDVTDSNGTLSPQAVESVVKAAWANDEVRRAFDSGRAIHFDVWTGNPDERLVYVSVAPADAPQETRVVAHVTPERGEVVTVKEPVTLNASTGLSVGETSDDDVTVNTDDDRLVLEHDASSDDNVRLAFDDGNETIELRSTANQTVETSEGTTITLSN
ncbi:hypothetical protein [Halorussus caseinilyticus]|uniref:Uncharacterized protein n=1 Tax=Halorussus caseinilyticus TaxID=3034025 RepID=A0ABD5WQZ8_9EURY|nr:hypothetical protein [Halorussus sp. DT72]